MTINQTATMTPAEIAQLFQKAAQEKQSVADYLAKSRKHNAHFVKQMTYAHDLLMDGGDLSSVRQTLLNTLHNDYNAHITVRTPANRYWLLSMFKEAGLTGEEGTAELAA